MKSLPQNNEERIRYQEFLKRVNKPANQREIKVNKFAKNSNYIPISFIEMKLDAYFFGFWQTQNFRTEVIVNEIVGSIDLKYKHPVSGEWLTRTGSAAVPIQLESGSGITQVEKKIHNTLVKDYPHLKAMCVLNAAKSIGKLFGRDLNRDMEDDYQPLLKLPETDPISNKQAQYIDSLLENSTLDERQRSEIERRIMHYDNTEAGEIIDYLLKHQKLTLDQELKQIQK